jgi:hypothetical protein
MDQTATTGMSCGVWSNLTQIFPSICSAFLCRYPYNPSLTEFKPIHNQPLKPHQRINHFPGIGVLADKSFLTTRHHDLKYILPAFGQKHRRQFEDYAMKHPRRKFVQKFVQNRGVKVVERSEIDFSRDYKIYQAFLDNPMLIDGRGFDMGVYGNVSALFSRFICFTSCLF